MTRLLLALIRLATPRADREFVVGDTVEEFDRIGQADGAAAARRWLRGELWRVLAAAPAHHLAARARRQIARQDRSGTSIAGDDIRHPLDWTTLATDLHAAWRGLIAGRGTTALAFAILTLSIAAGTVTFSIVDTVALRPLPFTSPESLVAVSMVSDVNGRTTPAAPQDYLAWRARGITAFEAMAAALPGRQLRLEGNDNESFRSRRITSNLFDVLGVHPFAGRFFSPEHEQPGYDGVAVLSHDLWIQRFGGDPGVIGRQVTFIDVGNQRATREIIGVLPPGVTYPITAGQQEPAAYVPFIPTEAEQSYAGGRSLSSWVVGRLRAGVTLQEAHTEIEHVTAAIDTFPQVRSDRIAVMSLHDRVVGPAKSWMLLALAAVGLVLLVACVNVASLLLARATVRLKELATREALGASRARLARGFLFEGLILSIAAAVAAVAISFWGISFAKSQLPAELARTDTIGVDARVLLVSVTVSILCGLAFASAPAWLASRSHLAALTKAGGAVIGGRRSARTLSAFLIAETAFVSLLLVATTLVTASFVIVTTMDLGFDRRNVMSIEHRKSFVQVPEADRHVAAAAFRADLLERVRAVPGVTSAALATLGGAPLSGGRVKYSLDIPGLGETPREDMLETRAVTAGYFETLGQQLLAGRTFDTSDRAGAPFVAIINDEAQRRFFPDRDPVGQVVTFQGRPTTIVGVLRSMRLDGPEADVQPELYVPIDQPFFRSSISSGTLVVRTAGPAPAAVHAIRGAMRPVLDGAEPSQTSFIDDSFRLLTASRRLNASVMTFFGLVAIVVGAMGVYGTMAFVVAQQVRAIGLRMALGASTSHVMRTVLLDAVRHVATGIAIGLAGAWAVSGVFASLVFGVTTTEVGVYLAVAGLVALVSLAAAFVPAIRAARVDPLIALRSE